MGGTEIQTLRIAEAARDLGFSNTVYYPEGAGPVAELFETRGIETEPYRQVQPSYSHPAPYWQASTAIARSFKSRNIGLVHCSDILGAHYAGWGARMARAKLISHVRNSHTALSRRDQTFLYLVQQFVFVSRGVQQALSMPERKKKGQVLYDVPGEHGEIAMNSLEARRKFGLRERGPVVGMAARLAPQKDFPTLIRAAKIVRQAIPDVQFLIAGEIDGCEVSRKYYSELQPLLDETGTRDIFHFAGFQKEMTQFYAAIDCFALSTNWEGLATVILEAMQYNKPVVATAVDGNPEIVLDEQTGLLAPPKSPQLLALQLIRMLTDRNMAQQMVANASRHLETNFGRPRFEKQVEEMYSKFFQGRSEAHSGIGRRATISATARRCLESVGIPS